MLKKIITWAIVIFLAFWLLTDHANALHVIQGFFDLLKNAANTLANFVNNDL